MALSWQPIIIICPLHLVKLNKARCTLILFKFMGCEGLHSKYKVHDAWNLTNLGSTTWDKTIFLELYCIVIDFIRGFKLGLLFWLGWISTISLIFECHWVTFSRGSTVSQFPVFLSAHSSHLIVSYDYTNRRRWRGDSNPSQLYKNVSFFTISGSLLSSFRAHKGVIGRILFTQCKPSKLR